MQFFIINLPCFSFGDVSFLFEIIGIVVDNFWEMALPKYN